MSNNLISYKRLVLLLMKKIYNKSLFINSFLLSLLSLGYMYNKWQGHLFSFYTEIKNSTRVAESD